MKRKRKPTRRDLLIVIGRLQAILGDIVAVNQDRNPNREDQVTSRIALAHDLCVEVRSHDPPIPLKTNSPWSVDDHPLPR